MIGAVAPFVPVAVGIGLKFSLLDTITGPVPDFIFNNYIRGLWLDLLVTAAITGVSWYLSGGRSELRAGLVFLVVPLASFVICIVLAVGVPKSGVANPLITVFAPLAAATLSLALSGHAVATWSRS